LMTWLRQTQVSLNLETTNSKEFAQKCLRDLFTSALIS